MRTGFVGASVRGMFLGWQSMEYGNEPVAVADPSEACRSRAAEVFGKMGYPLNAYAHEREMLERENNLDAVFIGSPDYAHYENLLACLDYGVAIYAEKPLVQQVAHAEEIYQKWKANPVPFCGGLELRYCLPMEATQEMLRDGVVGEPRVLHVREEVPGLGMHVHPSYRRKETGRSLLLQKGVHDLDLINWFVNARPTRVCATGGQAFAGPRNRPANYDAASAHEPKRSGHYVEYLDCTVERTALDPHADEVDMEDHYHVTIDYGQDKHATFTLVYQSPFYQHEFIVYGTEGRLVTFFNHQENSARIHWGRADGTRGERDFTPDEMAGGHGGGDPKILADFARMMAGGPATRADMKSACYASMLAAAAQDALESGAPREIHELT